MNLHKLLATILIAGLCLACSNNSQVDRKSDLHEKLLAKVFNRAKSQHTK